MVPKVPLTLFLFSLAYLVLTLLLHFRESLSLHHARASLQDIQEKAHETASRAANAFSSKNQSTEFDSHREQDGRHGSTYSAIEDTIRSTFSSKQESDPMPLYIREYWMRQANEVLWQLSSPCPFAAFGSVIVNHTDANGLGELVCMGMNTVREGNPMHHGEVAAINNCTSILTAPDGRYNLSPTEALAAFKGLSLYTNGEPCPMCASAIRWAGFKECIYGTSVETLTAKGWDPIRVSSDELFDRASHLPSKTRLVKDVLANETDPYFSWQFNASHPCPLGCTREFSETCEEIWAILERPGQFGS